jgi:YVTN family beta-propeller protein
VNHYKTLAAAITRSRGRIGWQRVLFAVSVFASCTASRAICAVLGTVKATLPFQSAYFVADPSQPYVYAAAPKANAIEVINTASLTVANSISLPGSPLGMAITRDGKTLFVADTTNDSIDVINTQTLALIRSIPTGVQSSFVASGLNNRVFVMGGGEVQQFDATSGASVGPAITRLYYGDILTSPDQKMLYYADHGLSPSTLSAYDVSTTSPTLLRQIQTGSNGEDTALSGDGTLICQPNGAPYSVTVLRSSNFSATGTFTTGAYPNSFAFSPNAKLGYVSHSPLPSEIDVFNTSTDGLVGVIPANGETTAMLTDPSGRELFVAYDGFPSVTANTVIYDTGVPEPSCAALVLSAIGAGLLYRWRAGCRPPESLVPAPRRGG